MSIRCSNYDCQSENPDSAKFCRNVVLRLLVMKKYFQLE